MPSYLRLTILRIDLTDAFPLHGNLNLSNNTFQLSGRSVWPSFSLVAFSPTLLRLCLAIASVVFMHFGEEITCLKEGTLGAALLAPKNSGFR